MLKLFFYRLAFIFVLIFFSLAIGLKTSIGFFYLLFWFILTFMLVSFASIVVGYFSSSLIFERAVVKKLEEDEKLDVKLTVKNTSFIPVFNFLFEDNLPCAASGQTHKKFLIDFLNLRKSSKFDYSCLCPKRGKYLLGPVNVYFFDPFGMFFFKKTFPVYSEVYVYPSTFPIKKFPPLTKGIMPWFGIETVHASGDEDEFFGVREYRAGDPIKRIHWFSSARKNSLVVRQFQRQSFFRATIFFSLEKSKNYGEGKESVAEYMIKIAASVAKCLIDSSVSVEIIAHAGEAVHIPFNKGWEHLDDIMRFLTIAQPESRISLIELFQDYSRHIVDNSSLIVIMLDKDWEHFSTMLSLDKRNVSLIPLIIMSSTFIYSFDKANMIIDAKQKISRFVNFNPIIFSKGDRLEEAFLR